MTIGRVQEIARMLGGVEITDITLASTPGKCWHPESA
jgi:DNA repair ATPase RecN